MSVLTEIVRERETWSRTHRAVARRSQRIRLMFDGMLLCAFAAVAYFCHDQVAAFVQGLF